jgi:hypothetical protein
VSAIRKIISSTVIIVLIAIIYYDMYYSPSKIEGEIFINESSDTLLIVPGMVIQMITNDEIWSNRGYSVYRSNNSGKIFEKMFNVPIPMNVQTLLTRSKYLRNRFVRHELLELLLIDNDTMVVFSGGAIYRTGDSGKTFQEVHKLDYYGYNIGRGVMPHGIAIDKANNLYYGDYGRNPDKNQVCIYRSVDYGITWHPVITFKEGEIRHVHAVQYDKYADKIWIATGDKDHECNIGYINSDDLFIPVMTGSQTYRAVSLLFSEIYIYWGMDSPNRQNYICRYDRITGEIDSLQKIDGPIYYSTVLKDGKLIMVSSVDGGTGEWDDYSTVWLSDDGENWDILLKTKKRAKKGVNANSRFPRGEELDNIILNFINTEQYHKSLYIMK